MSSTRSTIPSPRPFPTTLHRLSFALVMGVATAITAGAVSLLPVAADRVDIQHLQVTGALRLSHPFGVAVDRTRRLMYVADSLHNRVLEIGPSGAILHQWQGWKDKPFIQPGAVAVGRGGSVYVIDYGNNRIDRFATNGRPLQQWGSPGTAPGRFAVAQDLATDRAGNVYVADALNFRVQKFSPSGSFLVAWTTLTSPGGPNLAPMGIAVNRAGQVYVSEVATTTDRFGNVVEAPGALHCIQRFSTEGSPLVRWGTKGSLPGQFREPRGLAVDGAGRVYVADFGNNRIEQFTADGRFQRSIGPDMVPGLQLHGPVALSPDNRAGIYVADWFNNRIDRLSRSGTLLGFWR